MVKLIKGDGNGNGNGNDIFTRSKESLLFWSSKFKQDQMRK